MSRRSILLVVFFVILAAGVWRLWDKRDLLEAGATQLARSAGTADNQIPAQDQGNEHPPADALDEWEEDDRSLPPRAKPAPEFGPGDTDEMLPFSPGTPLLQTATEIPPALPPLVYVAYGQNSDDQNTSVSAWFSEFLKVQIRAQPAGPTLLNVLPNSQVLATHAKAFEPRPQSASFDAYVADAKVQGADLLILPVADGDTTAPQFQIKMVDLKSSRTEEWRPADPGSIRDVIVAGATRVMHFAGLDDATIDASGVKTGAPSDETFAQIIAMNPKDITWEFMQSLASQDPDCVNLYMYDYGTTSRLQMVNQGLTRLPGDVRLQIAKLPSLADNGSTTALIRYASELLRRYPDNLFVYRSLPDRLQKVFKSSMPPREVPAVYLPMRAQLTAFAEKYPESCGLQWDRAYMHQMIASYVRGTRTLDRMPGEQMEIFQQEARTAYDQMTVLARKYPDYPHLQRAYTYYMTFGGGAGKKELKDHIEHVAKLDPRAVEPELEAAVWHSIGYGQGIDYIRFIDGALKRHRGDVPATIAITKAIGKELSRQVGWEAMTDREAYGTDNSYLVRFLAGAEFVYSHGLNLGLEYDRSYYHAAETREQHDLIAKWHKTGQNSLAAIRETQQAMAKSDWETALHMSKAALPALDDDDSRHLCRYYIIKSLWKLKRYEESLKAAREGIMQFPREQTFPYMYAVVALEYGKDLETAFDCAWRAIDLGTTNQGCNETFEKLREKLNKPNHPALASRQ